MRDICAALFGRLSLLLALVMGHPALGQGLALERDCIDEPVLGGRVCVYQANAGAGHAVLLVHGIGGRALFDWEFLIPELSERFHVVALDLPGAGAPGQAAESHAPADYARLLRFIVEHYIDTPFSLVGHSMGAAVSLRYAARHPEGLERLVLADVAGILHGLALSKHLAGAWVESIGMPRASGFVERLTGKVLEELERLPVPPPELVEYGMADEEGTDPRASVALALAREDFSEAIATVEVPTLIIWGQRDRVAPLRTGIVLAKRMKNARLAQLAGVGHAAMRAAPDRFNALVIEFLASPLPAPPSRENRTAPASDRIGRCANRSGMVFEGDYRRIELRHCDNVQIRDATVGAIAAFESRVEISDSRVISEAVALTAEGSYVEATASDFVGKVAIAASRSRFDLAGVSLTGERAAVDARLASKFIFSVCDIETPGQRGHLHGFRTLENDRL